MPTPQEVFDTPPSLHHRVIDIGDIVYVPMQVLQLGSGSGILHLRYTSEFRANGTVGQAELVLPAFLEDVWPVDRRVG